MEAFPGLEDGETLGRETTLSGLMEHLGTTVTGHQDSQVMTGVMKTVFTCGSGNIGLMNGTIDPAAMKELLFARKVKTYRLDPGIPGIDGADSDYGWIDDGAVVGLGLYKFQ